MSRRYHAFTLIETLTALGIFCFAVLGLLFALHVTANAASDTQKDIRIRNQMESRLARLSLAPLKQGSSQAELDGVSYAEAVEPVEVRSGNKGSLPGYWKVGVTAKWKDGSEMQSWASSHLVWSP